MERSRRRQPDGYLAFCFANVKVAALFAAADERLSFMTFVALIVSLASLALFLLLISIPPSVVGLKVSWNKALNKRALLYKRIVPKIMAIQAKGCALRREALLPRCLLSSVAAAPSRAIRLGGFRLGA